MFCPIDRPIWVKSRRADFLQDEDTFILINMHQCSMNQIKPHNGKTKDSRETQSKNINTIKKLLKTLSLLVPDHILLLPRVLFMLNFFRWRNFVEEVKWKQISSRRTHASVNLFDEVIGVMTLAVFYGIQPQMVQDIWQMVRTWCENMSALRILQHHAVDNRENMPSKY